MIIVRRNEDGAMLRLWVGGEVVCALSVRLVGWKVLGFNIEWRRNIFGDVLRRY